MTNYQISVPSCELRGAENYQGQPHVEPKQRPHLLITFEILAASGMFYTTCSQSIKNPIHPAPYGTHRWDDYACERDKRARNNLKVPLELRVAPAPSILMLTLPASNRYSTLFFKALPVSVSTNMSEGYIRTYIMWGSYSTCTGYIYLYNV